jgi:hypothetical protein
MTSVELGLAEDDFADIDVERIGNVVEGFV